MMRRGAVVALGLWPTVLAARAALLEPGSPLGSRAA
jgi:hypothetical protein